MDLVLAILFICMDTASMLLIFHMGHKIMQLDLSMVLILMLAVDLMLDVPNLIGTILLLHPRPLPLQITPFAKTPLLFLLEGMCVFGSLPTIQATGSSTVT